MRLIYLSAHLDDAVLSCGGLIYKQVKAGMEVQVWTFFAATPEGKPPEHYQKRREEDMNATGLLGAKFVHFDYLDALDRGYARVLQPLFREDDDLILSVSNILKADLRPDDRVFCPLAVGKHVDHVILRLVCESLNLSGVRYYIDFPYVEYLPDALEPAAEKMPHYVVHVSVNGLEKWKDAVCEYKSQDLYKTQAITRQKIADYWKPVHGIVLYEKEER